MSSDSELVRAIARYLISSGKEAAECKSEIRRMLNAPMAPKFSGNAREDAEHVLLAIGAPVKLVGFEYCARAIAILVDDPFGCHKTMNLYRQIADDLHIASESVSGGVYNLVNTVFERGSLEVLVKYFGNAIDYEKGRVTPSEFLNRLAAYIRSHM